MVNRLLQTLDRWPTLEAVFSRLAGHLKTWPDDELGTFPDEPFGERDQGPGQMSMAPANFEMRFMRLHSEGRFDEMWEMLAEDAQRAWGGREAFIRNMPRFGDGTEVLDIQVLEVKVLERWEDLKHDQSYNDVAQVMLRYRLRQQWKDWTLDRQVHLIPAAGGWRTLCYPTVTEGAVKTR
jgi:hypothetical protein